MNFGLVPRFNTEKEPPTVEKLHNNDTSAYVRHFGSVLIMVFGVVLVSITLGVFLGPSVAAGPDLGMQVSIAAVIHVFIFFVAFNTRTSEEFAVRLNPYMTLTDYLLENSIDGTLTVVELCAQVLGALIASATFYGIVSPSPYPFVGTTGITGTTQVAAFFAELISTALMSWVFFSNRLYKNRIRMALSMAYIVGVTAGFVYPFIGLTTHNPLRWLASCVPSGACGAPGFWVYFTAPLAGIPLGWIIHNATSNKSGNNKEE